MPTLAHVSDLHATPVRVVNPLDFASKRFFGWLSWRVKRHRIHRPEVLEALVHDLESVAPDQIAITGDLTNVACAFEFPEARAWLERLGPPGLVSVIPGNHDAYVGIAHERSWSLWEPYVASDQPGGGTGFPTLRRRGELALVGLCSANPTLPFLASGTLGSAQLERLEKLLGELAGSGLCRVVMIHHPITEGAVTARRALTDADALRAVLERTGAELVIHGHGHHQHFASTPGPRGPIPVVGVASASDARHGQYHLYDVTRRGDGFQIRARVRSYDPARGSFEASDERAL
ncbi:MAG: metallophosphoesterase family protein [Myxococcota bacterium]